MTAVDWLVEMLLGNVELSSLEKIYIEQAKEMEKQQIIDAHGVQTKKNAGVSNYTYQLSGEEYYKQTFKQ